MAAVGESTELAAAPPAERVAPAWRIRVPRRAADGLAVAIVVVAWELLARTVFSGAYALSAPSAIVRQIDGERSLYLRNLAHTSVNAGWGFLWGNLVAMALAAVSSLFTPARRIVGGVSLTVFCLPLIALAPILRVVLGPGESTPRTLAALAVFFTTYVATLLGLDGAPGGALQVVRSYGRGRLVAFAVVRLRAAVPAIFAGLQIAAPAAFLGALVGEFTGSSKGLGILTVNALRTLETDRVWAVAVVSTVVSVIGYWLVGCAGRWLCPWSPGVDVTAPQRGRRRGVLSAALSGAATVLVVVVLWIGFLRLFEVDRYFAKTPADVWQHLVSGPRASETRALVLPALRSTLGTGALGFAGGLAAGLLLAVLFVLAPLVERALLPIAVALRAVPIIATTPVIILVFGRGVLATVVIVATMSFFPTLVNCAAAMRRTPVGILDVLHSYDAGALDRARVAHLPSALPALLASARIAVPTALLGATVAEWLATGRGIGNVMVIAANTADYNTLWVCVVLLTLAAVAGYVGVSIVERFVLGRVAPERAP